MSMLTSDKVVINAQVEDKYEAIRMVGQILVDNGHVPQQYIDKMIEREDLLSTDLGNGLAMPHGTNDSKSMIKSTGMAILTVPSGIDFGGDEPAKLIIGLAALGNDHMEILTNVAMLVSDDEEMERILTITDPAELADVFNGGL